ncbi:cytochrome P450 [Acaryochloris thomasi]|uniref:cytochrome P450 n=1 Tax=Acaryochloris thomasi TaxID=2929456 RepID=UPI000DA6CC82|nr:cytochrome P450 [Acaryochloris thomasi]
MTKTVPAPKTPLPLQLTQWILNPLGYLNTNFKRYGDIFNARVLWGESDGLIIVSDPKALQYILTHDVGAGKELSAPGDANRILASLLGEHNLLMLNGNQHRTRRQLVMPPFHGERLGVYGRLIQEITLGVISQWPTNGPIDVRCSMQTITMRVILQAVFGLHEGERYQQLERLLGQRLDITGSPITSAIVFLPWLQKDLGDWSPGGKFRLMTEQTDRLLLAEISERRAQADPERVDILSLLLAAKDEEGNGLTDQELRDELMMFLLVGHETTATALTWAMYWVHSFPEVKQRLMAELETVSDPADPFQFLQLPYLNAVCNETLRIYPVAMLTFPRRVEVPIELCGYQLEPGMLLMGAMYLVHQREELYPQPREFRPERFLERQFSPYEFIPFGAGARRCVGAALAQYELKIVLATILTRLDLNLVNKRPVKPGRRGVTLGQTSPVLVEKLRSRSVSKPLVKV